MNRSAPLKILARGVATDPASPGEGKLRIARYNVYPRKERGHGIQAACTHMTTGNLSFVLVATRPEATGELLRVSIRGLDEKDNRDTLARVLRCRKVGSSRFELSLEALEARGPRSVHRAGAGLDFLSG